MCLIKITRETFSLITVVVLLLGSLITLISATGIMKFQDVFSRSHAAAKSSTLSALLTLIGVLIYFIVNTGFFGVRLLLSLVFINLTSPVGTHLVTRAACCNNTYMYRKNDAHTHASILLGLDEQNSTEALQLRAKKRGERRKKRYQDGWNVG